MRNFHSKQGLNMNKKEIVEDAQKQLWDFSGSTKRLLDKRYDYLTKHKLWEPEDLTYELVDYIGNRNK